VGNLTQRAASSMLGGDPFRPDSGPNLTLARQYLLWLQTVRHRQLSTIKRYSQILVAWDAWLEGRSVLTATRYEMERFQTRPRVRRGAGTNGSASTQKQEVVVLRGFYGWLSRNGHLEKDPTTELYTPTVKNINPKPIPDDIWQQLFTPRTLPEPQLMILGLGGLCGLRREEIVSLEGRNIRGDMIVDFKRKGGGEDSLPWRSMCEIVDQRFPHLVEGWELFAEALGAASRTRGRLVVFESAGEHRQADEVNKLLVRITKRRGLPHVHPHMLRHTAATNLLRCGVPVHLVSGLLNHSSLDITMRYVKAGLDELNEWRSGRLVP
jgi:site-specific recombinase XerD